MGGVALRLVPVLVTLALTACAARPSVQPGTPSPVLSTLLSPTIPVLPSAVVKKEVSPFPSLAPVTPSPNPTRSTTPPPSEVYIEFTPWELVTALSWSPDGEILAVAAGERIHLYQTGSYLEYRVLEPHIWSPSIAFSPDGERLASAGRDGKVRIWDPAAGEALLEIQAHKKGCNAVAYSPKGDNLASAGNDGMVRIWDSSSGERLSEMIGGAFGIPDIAFLPDGSGLAIANGNIIRIRDVGTGRFVQTLRGEASFASVAIAPDGLSLAGAGSDSLLLLWDLPQGDIHYQLEDDQGKNGRPAGLIWQVAFSPDGSLLASAGGDGTLRLWNSSSGELVKIFDKATAAVTSLAFSPDGRWLASGGLDARVGIYRIGLP